MEKRLPLPVGTVLQGRYRIMRQLGHGGFGAVYEAVDDEINLSFALKETFYAADEELRQAFKREARMLASLSHEAFPRVTHYFTEGDGCFLVMELIHGDDLDKLLARRDVPFEQTQVLEWADQILDALEDLHEKGIIHRDIKPSNLKLTPKGKIKLLDFGIAKGALEGETTIMTTVGSMAAATLQYAPLEQVLKASPQYQMMLSVVSSGKVMEIMKHGTNASSDLYAFAATLYQLLTKTLPADAPTRALAVWSGQRDRLIPPHEVNSQISIGVSEVLQRAMRLDKRERIQTAAEMRRTLAQTLKPIAPVNFAPPETVKVTEDFSPPVVVQNPPTVKIEPLKADNNTEVTKLRETKKTIKETKKPIGLYAAVIGVPILFLMLGVIGLTFYFSIRAINSTANVKYELAQTLTGQTEAIFHLEFSPDGKQLASGGAGNNILIWDAASGLRKETINEARSPAFSPDGKFFAFSQSSDPSTYKLMIRLVSTGRTSLLSSSDKPFVNIKFSSDGNYIYYNQTNDSGVILLYRVPMLGGATAKIKEYASSAIVSPNNKLVAGTISSDADKLYIWDGASGDTKKILTGNAETKVSAFWTAFSPDSKKIAAVASSDINIWDLSDISAQQSFGGMMFFQDYPAGTFKTPTRTLGGHTDNVTSLAFSPDGKLFASGGEDKKVQIWDAASGKLVQTVLGHSGTIYAIAFSPDGKLLATGSDDQTIKLWRMK